MGWVLPTHFLTALVKFRNHNAPLFSYPLPPSTPSWAHNCYLVVTDTNQSTFLTTRSLIEKLPPSLCTLTSIPYQHHTLHTLTLLLSSLVRVLQDMAMLLTLQNAIRPLRPCFRELPLPPHSWAIIHYSFCYHLNYYYHTLFPPLQSLSFFHTLYFTPLSLQCC